MDFPDVFAERLETYTPLIFRKDKIYTHPKAAAAFLVGLKIKMSVSTHSHPKVAASAGTKTATVRFVSTHSHPKVAASDRRIRRIKITSFNTQPPEGGCRQNGMPH